MEVVEMACGRRCRQVEDFVSNGYARPRAAFFGFKYAERQVVDGKICRGHLDESVVFQMLDRLEKAAGAEAQQPLAAQPLDLFIRKLDVAAAHRALPEGEIVISKVLQNVRDGLRVAASREGQESRGKEIEEAVHAASGVL